MSNNNLLPFDLEVALKQPERVVYRNGEKPIEWIRFIKRRVIASIRPSESGGIIKHDINGKYDPDYENGYLDLMLLPEFTPEDRKWYWVKTDKDSQYKAAFYHYGLFVCGMTKYSPLNLHTIHPEPINPPE
jgi:hypothetical protein